MKTEEALPHLRTFLREQYTPEELEQIASIPTLADSVGDECAKWAAGGYSYHFIEVQQQARKILKEWAEASAQ